MLHENIIGHASTAPVSFGRSPRSLAFEAFWRALPRSGALPRRSDISMKNAAPFLQHMMLMEIRLNGAPAFPVRLVGGAMHDRIQHDIVGHDYLSFLPPQYQKGATESARLMVEYPCGLWQITPLHFSRGFAQNHEITGFPLDVAQGEPPLLVGLFEPMSDLVAPYPSTDKVMLADTAAAFEFLDAGAGVPDWPAS